MVSQRLGAQTDPFVLVQRVSKNSKGEEEVSDVQEIYDSESVAGNDGASRGIGQNARRPFLNGL